MYGIDLSNHNRNLNLESLNFDFAIIKATEGLTLKDKSFDKYVSQLVGMGKLIGCYHFTRPDNRKNKEGMIKEAEWFISVVKDAGLLNEAILCLDYEVSPYYPEFAKAWLDYVATETNATPFIYGSSSVMLNFIKADILKPYKIWLAKWPSSDRLLVGETPGLVLPSKEKFNWDIWQYSSNGYALDYDGRIDLDYSSLTVEEWRKLAYNAYTGTEPLSDDMKWAIKMGIFKGYPDGTYKPYDAVTRSQLATILHRMYKDELLNQIVGEDKEVE